MFLIEEKGLLILTRPQCFMFPVRMCTLSFDLEEPAYKNPRLALWSASKNGLGWLGLTLARASKNIQASLGWRKNRQC